jgi:hypothetical protein
MFLSDLPRPVPYFWILMITLLLVQEFTSTPFSELVQEDAG